VRPGSIIRSKFDPAKTLPDAAENNAKSRYPQLRTKATTQTAINSVTSQSKIRAIQSERFKLRFERIEILPSTKCGNRAFPSNSYQTVT
jgi:hypothetical protein